MLPAIDTPLIRLGNLFADRRVYAKCEFLAPSGCFKIHGAVHLLARLSQAGQGRRLVVPSMGNTALGAAVGARAFGFAMTGVVPETISRAKDEKLQALGVALVKVAGADIRAALRDLFGRHALVVEPSGAIAVAFVGAHLQELAEPVCVILTGGNIARDDFDRLITADAL